MAVEADGHSRALRFGTAKEQEGIKRSMKLLIVRGGISYKIFGFRR
jgi:hypothetical protein